SDAVGNHPGRRPGRRLVSVSPPRRRPVDQPVGEAGGLVGGVDAGGLAGVDGLPDGVGVDVGVGLVVPAAPAAARSSAAFIWFRLFWYPARSPFLRASCARPHAACASAMACLTVWLGCVGGVVVPGGFSPVSTGVLKTLVR